MHKFILAYATSLDSLRLIGPFDNEESAIEYAKTYCCDKWVIVDNYRTKEFYYKV